MKYKVKRKPVNHTKEIALLLLLFVILSGCFGVIGYYAGQRHVLMNQQIYYANGCLVGELDGRETIYFIEE